MTTILCPTRGGTASYPNQDMAISLAAERQLRLVFMYVYDIQFVNMVSSPILADLEEEMDELGEFLLAMAQERADKQGVEAEAVVRHGVFRKALKDVIKEYNVDIVTMGASVGKGGYTDLVYIEELVNDLQSTADVDVYILRDGELTAEYPAKSTNSE